MRHLRLLCIAFLLMNALSIYGADDNANKDNANKEDGMALKDFDIVVGLEKILKLDFIPNAVVKIANESLVNYQIVPSKKEVLLTGLKAGETTLTLRDNSGDVKVRYLLKVTASDQSKVVLQLKDLLKDIEGLEIGVRGDVVYVGGHIIVPDDIGRVVLVLNRFPDVLREVELAPQTKEKVGNKMQAEINKAGFKEVTVRVVNGLWWLEGTVESEEQNKTVEQIAYDFIPDQIASLSRQLEAVQTLKRNKTISNYLRINSKPKQDPMPKLFKIAAQFVELTKGYDRLFSFTWNPTIAGDGGSISMGQSVNGGVTTSSNGSLSATIANLFPKLQSAKSAGHARVMESGVVIVKEGVAANLSKSNKIPFQLGTVDNAKAMESVSGFNMNITPRSLADDKIDLKLTITVNFSSADSPPQTMENKIDTSIVVKSQESAVVGGVVTNKMTTDFDKNGQPGTVTGGSSLFSFIKSKKYTTDRTQSVIFITPEIIESASSGAQDVEKKFRKRSR